MSEIDTILQKLDRLGVKDTKRVAVAVQEHLEELDELKAYDAAKARKEPVQPLSRVLARYAKSKNA